MPYTSVGQLLAPLNKQEAHIRCSLYSFPVNEKERKEVKKKEREKRKK